MKNINKMEEANEFDLTAKYITVLDFSTGDVCQYPIEIWNIDNETVENLIENLGHRLKDCEWMVHKNEPIIH